MTETELRIADLELRIGDCELAIDHKYTQGELDGSLLLLIERNTKLRLDLECLKQSLPVRQSE